MTGVEKDKTNSSTNNSDSYSFLSIIIILVVSFVGVLFSNFAIILFLKSKFNVFGLTKQVNKSF